MPKKIEPLSESYYYILLCLSKGPLHGYGIMQLAAQLSDGEVRIGSGTMYGATSNLMKKKWIKEVMIGKEGMERKRMYQLTKLGEEALDNEIKRLERLLKGAKVIGGQKDER